MLRKASTPESWKRTGWAMLITSIGMIVITSLTVAWNPNLDRIALLVVLLWMGPFAIIGGALATSSRLRSWLCSSSK